MLNRDVTVIVKVTNSCDMRCRYCFIEPAIFSQRMSDQTAQRVVHAFLDSDAFDSVRFVWHGGEPLLRGPAFFARVFAEQRACTGRVAYSNATQTNATHLDEQMLELLLSHDVTIGLSLDGPAELTDPTRQPRRALPIVTSGNSLRPGGSGPRSATLRGGAAHDTTTRAAARLQQRGVPAAAIVTVNRTNVVAPQAVYAEFRDRGIHMKINPLTRSGLASADGADLGVTAQEYGRFLVRVFDAWFDDPDPRVTVDPFGQHLARILGDAATHSCFYALSCHRYFLGVSPTGDLFPCGMFQGEPSFKYGNIHQISPEDVARTVLFGDITAREVAVLEQCSRCAFLDLCYGGCMFHSLKDSQVLAEKDYYCTGYRMYFEHVLRRVHADLDRALRVCGTP